MARPKSDGLSYFPFDVDFFSDIKIKSLRAHFGADGIALYIYCLCEIYRSGYCVKISEDFIDCAAADLGLTADKTRQIMKFFCKRSLFDDILYVREAFAPVIDYIEGEPETVYGVLSAKKPTHY